MPTSCSSGILTTSATTLPATEFTPKRAGWPGACGTAAVSTNLSASEEDMADSVTPRRVHITGASGSGTTTLGHALAARFGWRHLDTDDHFWLPTDPPFQQQRPVPERLALLCAALAGSGWVLSGAV